jgi:signal transduction histidine kinase
MLGGLEMKNMTKILIHYVLSAVGVAIILLILNITFFIVFFVSNSDFPKMEYSISEISKGLILQDGHYTINEKTNKLLLEHYQWAMLLDDKGNVIWSENLPEAIPTHYSVPEVASFSHWYLNDYPVYVWRHPSGLLVLANAKNSLWKLGLQMPQALMDKAPLWLMSGLILNGIAAIILALILGFHLFQALSPIAKGIDDIAKKKPVKLNTGGMLGHLATNINQTSKELQLQQQALQKRDNARTTWIAGVSHDIRTPLSMVMAYASQLEENPLLPTLEQKQARIIRQNSEKIKTLISDLNLASKLEYDMQPIKSEAFYLSELVRKVVTDFLNGHLKHSFSIALNIEESMQNFLFSGDSKLLERALCNLINNSIHHNPNGCSIEVDLSCAIDYCHITIADNGIGYPTEVLEANLTEFSTKKLHTHGMGLIIVNQIIKNHGGLVEYKNSVESGAISILKLPI